jgi:uncharacterized protein
MKQHEQAAGSRVDLVHNEAQSRYELHLDGRLVGKAEYRRQDGRIVFTHTVVEPAHEGQGFGSKLAGYALDDVKTRGIKAVAKCSFIARYVARHGKEYAGVVE